MNNRNKNMKRGGGSLAPPPLSIPISIGKVFRFQATAAGSTDLTPKSLGDLLVVASTTISAYQLADAVRIRKIEMWGPPASTLVPITVSCDFNGAAAGSFGPSRKVSDTSIGATRVAHLVAKPPRDSQVSQWQSASNTALICNLVYPANCIIDVHYSLTMKDSAGAVSVTGAVVGATVGQLYLRSLDSYSGTAVLPPVSYITI